MGNIDFTRWCMGLAADGRQPHLTIEPIPEGEAAARLENWRALRLRRGAKELQQIENELLQRRSK